MAKPEPTSFIAIAALSLCLLLPLRVYQTTSLIEPDTGFFSQSHFTVTLFYIIGAVVIASLMILSFLNSKAVRTRNCVAKSKALGVVSAFAALSITLNAVTSFIDFVEIIKLCEQNMTGAFEYSLIVKIAALIPHLVKEGGAALIFQSVFGALAALFFWVYTVSCFNKNAKISSFSVLSVAPTIWAVARIIFRFVEKISFVNISDLLLELIMLVFLIMFFLSFAQVVTRVSPEVSAWRLFGCGLPAAIVAFLISVPRLFLIVVGHSDLIVEGYEFELCDLAIAIFIPVFLFFTSTAKNINKKGSL